jgi:hypothetical protein
MTVKTIVALFDEFDDAQAAVNDLTAAGIAQSQISIVANDADRRRGSTLTDAPGTVAAERARDSTVVRTDDDDTRTTSSSESYAGEGAGTGATIGAVLGGGGGLLAGLGLLAIPGIGPVVAAGPLIAALTGAGAGAAAGGIIGGLVGLGIPEHEAHTYAEGVRRGGTLVTVRAEDTETDRVTDILERHNPVDVDERGRDWQQSGWSRFDEASSTPYPAEDIARDRERYRTMFGATGVGRDTSRETTLPGGSVADSSTPSTYPPSAGTDAAGSGLSGNADLDRSRMATGPGTTRPGTMSGGTAGTTGSGLAGTGGAGVDTTRSTSSMGQRRTRSYNVGGMSNTSPDRPVD